MSILKKLFQKTKETLEKDIIQSKTKYADSSSIPESERQFYQSDEYYTIKAFEGTPFEFVVIPFDERKKSYIPSSRGLYVPEILMLSYCKSFPNPKNGYPGYWWFKYGVRDVGSMLKSLEKRGFIEIDSKKGKYKATKLGEDEIADNEYVVYTHKNSKLKDFTAWHMNEILGTGDKSKWLDIYCEKTGDLPPLEKTNTKVNKYDPNNKQPIKPRISLDKIKNKNDFEQGFIQGYHHYQKGEQLRKVGDIYASIEEYDKARSKGYDAPALYWSYAMAFRKLKEYEEELDIINEALTREVVIQNASKRFNERKEKVIELIDKFSKD